jgi:AcrR family transcriptional regulator
MAKDQTKDKIMSVAAKIFAKYGFQKTTVDEIARSAHKAKGSVYYYFESKEELFKAVVEQEIGVLKTGLTRVIVDSTDARSMFRNYLMNRMMLMKDSVNYHEALKADFIEDYEFLNDTRENFMRFEVDLMQAVLDRGVREKIFDIKETTATAKVIIFAIKAIEVPFYNQHRISEYEQTIVELIDILVRGLGRSH